MGVRTVINMRGERDCGSFRLAAAACARHGVKLVNFPFLFSRFPPTREAVQRARGLFDSIEYPALVHCKSGADRAGLLSCLYLIFREDWPVEKAIEQLHIRYGHIKQAQTGVLDRFFERYIDYNRETAIAFSTWVETVYDRNEVLTSFRARSWAVMLIDWILRRE